MKRIFFSVVLLLLFSLRSSADLQSSFLGSRTSALTRNSTILEYDGTTGLSNQNLGLIDVSGENLCPYSETFGSWTLTRATVTADQYKNPINGALTADVLREDNTGASNHVVGVGFTQVIGNRYTYSGYIRKLNRTWVLLETANETARGYFDLNTGVVGSSSNVVSTGMQRIVGDWYRVWIRYVATTNVANTAYIYIAEGDLDIVFDGLTQDSLIVYGAQIVDNTDNVILGPGIYHPTTATVKPRHDLAPTNTPITAYSDFQDASGNRIPARNFNGTTQYYSKAHHDSMNVVDGDHTITYVIKKDVTALGTQRSILCHGTPATGGFETQFQAPTNNRFKIDYYNAAGGSNDAYSTTVYPVDLYHIVQIIRSSNIVTVYANGVAGNPVNMAGYGNDTNRIFYMGYQDSVGNYFMGDILYARLDSEALSTDALSADREALRGVYDNWSKANAWTFSRSTTAFATYSNGTMESFPVNVPRVAGPGGGILIENQVNQLIGWSEDFTQAAVWTAVRASIPATNTDVDPTGDAHADTFHEDATAAQTHYIQGAFACTASSYYTISVYVKPVAGSPRDWIDLYFWSPGGGVGDAYFDTVRGVIGTQSSITMARIQPAAYGYSRYSVTDQAGGTGTCYFILYIAEGDTDVTFDGLDQDDFYVWGAQAEANKHPTSYIEAPSATVPVTRTADSMTLDPHPASSNEYIIPELFSPTGTATKLTVELEVKSEFVSATDIGVDKSIIEISGNSGTAGSTRNRVLVKIMDSGRVMGIAYDDSSTNHNAYSAVNVVNYDQWYKCKFFVDFADLTRMELWINGSNAGMAYTARTGTGSFDTTNCLVRVGQANSGVGTGNGNSWVRNLRITPSEF